MTNTIRVALFAGLAAIAMPAAAGLQIGCGNDLFPPGHSIAACQEPSTVSPNQSFVVLGQGYPAGYDVARAYFKREGGKNPRPLTLLAQGSRSSDGRVYSDSKVRPDRGFNVIVRMPAPDAVPEIPDGPQTLWIELRGFAGGRVDVHELPIDLVVRKNKPWKRMGREAFDCEGPVAGQSRYELHPLSPPMIGSVPEASCFSRGTFSFSGGPYEELRVVGMHWAFYLVSDSGKEVPIQNCVARSVLPDQNFRANGCVMPDLAGRVILRIREKIQGALPPGWHRDLASLNLQSRPQLAVEPPRTPPAQKPGPFRTTLTGIRQQSPDFLHPIKETLYPGQWAVATIANAKYATGSRGGFSARCPVMLGDRPLDTSYSRPTVDVTVVSFQVPKDMASGPYALNLSCANEPFWIDGREYEGIEAQGEQPAIVGAPRPAPRGRVIARAADLTGNSAIDDFRKCKPCNGDPFELELTGLDPRGDFISEAKWTNAVTAEGWFDETSRRWVNVIATDVRAAADTIVLPGRILDRGDTNSRNEHRIEISLRDQFNNRHTMTVGPDDGRGAFNFFKSCPKFDPATQPRIENVTREFFPGQGRIAAHVSNLECSARVTAFLESRAIPGGKLGLSEDRAGGGVTDADGNLRETYGLSPYDGSADSFIRSIKEPTTVEVVFETYAGNTPTGRRAKAQITIYPMFYLTLKSPPPIAAGQRIEAEWKGFKSNTSADVFLDNTRLTNRSLMLDAGDPVVTVRLPEGVTGRRKLMLTDTSGNTASTFVEIEGGPGNADKPKDPAALCEKPCIQVPDTAAQGDTIAVRFSGFRQNTLINFTMQGKWILKGQYQSGPVDAFDYLLPHGLPDGDYDIVGESGEGAEKLTAKDTIRVAGKRKLPTLEAVPVPLPGNKFGWYRLGVNRIHVRGQHWIVRAPFSADLVGVTAGFDVDRDRIYSLATPHLDGCPASGCNLSLGEISQFWQMDATVRTGRYVLRLSDGISEAITKAFDVLPTEDAVDRRVNPKGGLDKTEIFAGETVTFSGEDFPLRAQLQAQFDGQPLPAGQGSAQSDDGGRVRALSILVPAGTRAGPHEIAILVGPPIAGQAAEAPRAYAAPMTLKYGVTVKVKALDEVNPKPERGAKVCDPELPRLWQPGCVEAGPKPAPSPVAKPPVETPTKPGSGPVSGPPASKPVPPPPQRTSGTRFCDPNVPRYAQVGCVESTAPPPAAPTPSGPTPGKPPAVTPTPPSPGSGQPCNPNVPRYAQPGCTP